MASEDVPTITTDLVQELLDEAAIDFHTKSLECIEENFKVYTKNWIKLDDKVIKVLDECVEKFCPELELIGWIDRCITYRLELRESDKIFHVNL